MGQVTAYGFHVEDPNQTGSQKFIPKGTPRSEELDKLLGHPDPDNPDNLVISDHVYTDEDDVEHMRVKDRQALRAFGDVDESTGQVDTGQTGLATPGDAGDTEAPRRNAERKEWAQFMRDHGQPVEKTDTRDDLVRRAEDAGLI